MTPAAGRPNKRVGANRSTPLSAARLAAVQALYQMDMAATDVNDVLAEFCEHRLGDLTDSSSCQDADPEFFSDIVKGVVAEQRRIDPILNAQLADGWRLSRIDSILRAILRSAAFELLQRPDVPARVVINEYVDVAHAFFEKDEPRVVNGILDALAHAQRADEFQNSADG